MSDEPRLEDKVKLLVFDMGHVFVDFDWTEVKRGFCARANVPAERMQQALAHVGSLGYEHGKVTTAVFLSELNDQLQSSLSMDDFKRLWTATFHENAEMAALLQVLKSSYPLYLLSNTNEVHWEHLQDTYNVARHFDELILSYKVGLKKPDRSIYEEVLTRSGLSADQCLFVDDLEENVRAACEVGMQTIRFTSATDLKVCLTARGILK